jgi:hypothetical protein
MQTALKAVPDATDGVAVALEHACDTTRVKVPDDDPAVEAPDGEEGPAPVGRTAARVAVLETVLDDLWELVLKRI